MANVSVSQAYLAECPNCAETLLVRSDLKTGDRLLCCVCHAKMRVDMITAPYEPRESKTKTHETEFVY